MSERDHSADSAKATHSNSRADDMAASDELEQVLRAAQDAAPRPDQSTAIPSSSIAEPPSLDELLSASGKRSSTDKPAPRAKGAKPVDQPSVQTLLSEAEGQVHTHSARGAAPSADDAPGSKEGLGDVLKAVGAASSGSKASGSVKASKKAGAVRPEGQVGRVGQFGQFGQFGKAESSASDGAIDDLASLAEQSHAGHLSAAQRSFGAVQSSSGVAVSSPEIDGQIDGRIGGQFDGRGRWREQAVPLAVLGVALMVLVWLVVPKSDPHDPVEVLQQLDAAVQAYALSYGRLPSTLSELEGVDDLRGVLGLNKAADGTGEGAGPEQLRRSNILWVPEAGGSYSLIFSMPGGIWLQRAGQPPVYHPASQPR